MGPQIVIYLIRRNDYTRSSFLNLLPLGRFQVYKNDITALDPRCFGFGLFRQLSAMGVMVVLAAPGLIPRKPADRIKTDRRDAHSLALALRAGQLTGIYIPTEQDESVRDYLRMYESLRGDVRVCKQRILHFLLRRGIRYDGGGPWTVKHRHWLSTLEFSQARDRQTLDR